MNPIQYGVAWYSEAEWSAWRQSVSDPEMFEEHFSDWKKNAEQRIKELEKQGLSIRRVPIRVESFLGWCAQKNSAPDAAARVDYVCEIQKATDEN